jgi:hypothetical protein
MEVKLALPYGKDPNPDHNTSTPLIHSDATPQYKYVWSWYKPLMVTSHHILVFCSLHLSVELTMLWKLSNHCSHMLTHFDNILKEPNAKLVDRKC